MSNKNHETKQFTWSHFSLKNFCYSQKIILYLWFKDNVEFKN